MADACSHVAGWLDWLMLEQQGAAIAPAGQPILSLPRMSGVQIFRELGGRFLLRYLRHRDVGRFIHGDTGRHWLTPTAYSPIEALSFLALPVAHEPREVVLMLDPRRIDTIYGPQWVAGQSGLQYIVLDGFPRDAIVVPGAPGQAWELAVR